VEDWRYENLRDEVARLRERTHKLEIWRMLLPMRVFVGICWIFNAGMIAFVIARAAAH
jgi:hypothetical protein